MPSKRKLCIILNPNGLGHIIRNIKLIKKLNYFFDITIISDKWKVLLFLKKKIKILEINLKLSSNNLNYKKDWIKKFNFNKYDLIFSDNLPEVCFLDKKIILFANFFFHHIKFYNKNIDLVLKKKKIRIYGNYIIQDNKLKKFNNYQIGFLENFTKRNFRFCSSLLISIGTADKSNDNKIINSFKKINYDNRIYIEPRIFSKIEFKNNYRVASYSHQMFSNSIGIALIKLGTSTIINCLKNGIYIVTIDDFITNEEFLINYKNLKKYKLVKKYKNLEIAISKIKKLTDSNLQNYFYRCKNLKWDHMDQFVNIIKKY